MASKVELDKKSDGFSSYNPASVIPSDKIGSSSSMVLPKGNSLTVSDHDHISEFKTAQKTLKTWKEIAYDRLGTMRAAASQNPSDELAKKLFNEDRQKVVQYEEIVKLFDQGLDSIITKTDESSKKIFRVVRDQDRNIQAMSIFTVSDSGVFLNLVLTAPWNLRMHASNQDIHLTLVSKGGGTTLIRSGYETAQQLGKEELRLKPMDGSYTYYKERLGMIEDPNGDFFYPVTEKLPEQLLET
ncbi:MAG: hypothetical protein JSS60_04025 [Verrucomicrobia bacterium]|nr:hypothetical protein [Verrucomicrobiota bacterium]